tara:strand:+ start:30 stop:530 length:501 start_codon:yes stop_codon:yes gene_type:complete
LGSSSQVAKGGNSVPGVKAERLSYVEEEVMYWRKANHIHKWFVDNVQSGEDNCERYFVSEENLRQLLDVCNKVIEASKLKEGTICMGTVYNKDHPNGLMQRAAGKVIADTTVASTLLPTAEGFFFGGTEYDEDYLTDVIDTRDWTERTLAEIAAGAPGDIYYFSSW